MCSLQAKSLKSGFTGKPVINFIENKIEFRYIRLFAIKITAFIFLFILVYCNVHFVSFFTLFYLTRDAFLSCYFPGLRNVKFGIIQAENSFFSHERMLSVIC